MHKEARYEDVVGTPAVEPVRPDCSREERRNDTTVIEDGEPLALGVGFVEVCVGVRMVELVEEPQSPLPIPRRAGAMMSSACLGQMNGLGFSFQYSAQSSVFECGDATSGDPPGSWRYPDRADTTNRMTVGIRSSTETCVHNTC